MCHKIIDKIFWRQMLSKNNVLGKKLRKFKKGTFPNYLQEVNSKSDKKKYQPQIVKL